MSRAEHTPIPWDVETVGGDLCILAGRGERFGEPISLIATMTDPCEFGKGVQRANAELIVRAVNSLPRLLEALRIAGAVEILDRIGNHSGARLIEKAITNAIGSVSA